MNEGNDQSKISPRTDLSSLDYFVLTFWQHRYLIVLGTVVCGVAGIIATFFQPTIYEARATLIIQQPLYSTELRPKPLFLGIYQRMLTSDLVVSKIVDVLVAEGTLSNETSLRKVRNMLSVQLFQNRDIQRANTPRYLPIIDLVVRSNSPETSVLVANTWASVFQIQSDSLSNQTKSSSLQIIESQYQIAKSHLAELESSLSEKENQYSGNLLQFELRWNSEITEFKKETNQLEYDYKSETEVLRLEFIDLWKPGLLKQKLTAQTTRLTTLDNEWMDAEFQVKSKRDSLERIQERIENHPQFLVISKAIADEALWQKIGESDKSLPADLDQIKLRSELLNPVYTNLAIQLVETQISYDTLVSRNTHLQGELNRLREEIGKLQRIITDKEIELVGLLNERGTGLAQLELEREAALEKLETKHATDLALLERDKESDLNPLIREKNTAVATYSSLAKKFGSTGLAEVEEDSDVKITALAVQPRRPISRDYTLMIIGGFVFGLLFSVLLSLTLNYFGSVFSRNRA